MNDNRTEIIELLRSTKRQGIDKVIEWLDSEPSFAKEAQDQQKARRSMLAIAVWGADKLDASRHPAGRLHRDR